MTWEGRLKHPNIATSAIEITVYRNVENCNFLAVKFLETFLNEIWLKS